MVGASKILTVSYGTFSCTLEGFDDSFNTMKAIAEYFRDLAAEDRYFGAEPPAPDAEMLARIAEKEVSRRVEARIKDNNVVLRQQEAPALEPQRAAPSPIPPQPVARSAAAESPRKPAFQAAPAAAPASADADSIAAKLQRIRAVVAQAPEEDFSEDEHADDMLETAAAEIAHALGEDDATGATGFEDEDEDEDDIARALDRLDLGRAAAQQPDTRAEEAEETDEDALGTSLFADLEDGGAADQDGHDAAASLAAEEDADEAPAPAPAPRVRITKVKRSDFDKALASGRLQDTGSRPQPDPAPAALSEEDEADLMRELAQVEAEILAASEQPDDTAASDDSSTAAAQPAASRLADSDVSRLMAAADERLEDPESASSREAYSHLRAAVAAAKAGPAGGSGESDDAKAYREDLASVVRPRRPGTRQASSERPPAPASRPAPLKLVAAQRIDQGAAADPSAGQAAGQPVRPRRVSAAVLGEQPETGGSGFAAYAEERGAAELHELLEAAAAYMSFVEGRNHFSRPQLMNKVRSAGSSDFNREDGLRSFGQLLRDGKIERSGNGQFTASGDIGFKPGKRAAG